MFLSQRQYHVDILRCERLMIRSTLPYKRPADHHTTTRGHPAFPQYLSWD